MTLAGGLLALMAAGALAGGMATATISAGDHPPTAGEEREVRVVLLQHGTAPVDHGTVTISAWLPGSSQRIDVPATSIGDGEWTAAVTFPVEGEWRIQVHHTDLQTPAPLIFPVASASVATSLPGVAPVAALLLATVGLVGAVLFLRRRAAGTGDATLGEPARAG